MQFSVKSFVYLLRNYQKKYVINKERNQFFDYLFGILAHTYQSMRLPTETKKKIKH